MNSALALRAVYAASMDDGGFMHSLRSNAVREDLFAELMGALSQIEITSLNRQDLQLLMGCLWEAPWEIENRARHYAKRDEELGRRVSQMADELRVGVGRLLWQGLDLYQGRWPEEG